MERIFSPLQKYLEKIDNWRDQVLFVFIKPYWPRFITPNAISWMRVALSVFLFIILFFLNIESKALIISIFIFGAFSDLLDGSVARGLNKVTEFGKMLDPAADRILIIPIAFYSLYASEKWLLLAIIIAEIVNGFVSLFHRSKESVESNIFGKTKMAIQSVSFAAILIFWPTLPSILVNALWVGIMFSIISIFIRVSDMINKGYVKKPKNYAIN